MRRLIYKQGDVVLAFDIVSEKIRPFLVINSNLVLEIESEDLIVARITKAKARNSFDVSIDWKSAGLDVPSVVRTAKHMTILQASVRRVLGHLSEEDKIKVFEKVQLSTKLEL